MMPLRRLIATSTAGTILAASALAFAQTRTTTALAFTVTLFLDAPKPGTK